MSVGGVKYSRVLGEGRNDVNRYVSSASLQAFLISLTAGNWKGTNIPFVASDACCRNTVGLAAAEPVGVVGALGTGKGSWRMSMGIARRWQANMAFIMGMY